MAISFTLSASRIASVGRALALAGIILPLLLIGGLKFTAPEVEALKPLIGNTPWLRWLYVMGHEQASYFLGVVEIAAATLLLISPWSRKAAVAGSAIAAFTLLVTSSLLLLPLAWDPHIGFPALGPLGQFLIKDVAMLGVALACLGEKLGQQPASGRNAF